MTYRKTRRKDQPTQVSVSQRELWGWDIPQIWVTKAKVSKTGLLRNTLFFTKNDLFHQKPVQKETRIDQEISRATWRLDSKISCFLVFILYFLSISFVFILNAKRSRSIRSIRKWTFSKQYFSLAFDYLTPRQVLGHLGADHNHRDA